MTTETRKLFHAELDELNESVVRLAGMAGEAVERASEAFLTADLELAESLITGDREIDELTWTIEDRVFHLLARQQPMAGDLRSLVTIIRVIHEIERIADNMVNVAKSARRMFPHLLEPPVRGLIQRMREQTVLQLRTAVQAFVEKDHSLGSALDDMDDVMDELQKELIRTVIAIDKTEESVQNAIQLALVSRYFERAADHAVNFGGRVTFMVTGSMVEDPGAGSTGPGR